MKKTSRVSRIVLIGAAAAIVLGTLGVRPAAAKENPANDCLVAVEGPGASPDVSVIVSAATVACTDGDSCDDDGATDGSCSFKIKGCVNVPGVSGCTLRPIKTVKFKTKPVKNIIQLTPNATEATSVCGAFVDLKVPLKQKGSKPPKAGKGKVIATATANVKPNGKNKDKDTITFICNPCATDSCVPATTSTTSTSTSTTTSSPPATLPVPPCGDGVVGGSEACDGSAAVNGCTAGTPFCNTTCTGCQATCSQLAFTLGAPTTYCGFPGQNDPAVDPLSGHMEAIPEVGSAGTCVANHCNNGSHGTNTSGGCAVDADCGTCLNSTCNNSSPGTDGVGACIVDADCMSLSTLGSGCLYIGGGNAKIVPPGPTPNGSTTVFGVADCSQNALALTATDTGNARTCTVGPQTIKHCVNGHPGTNGQGACAMDSDCQPVCLNSSGQSCGAGQDCGCIDGSPGIPAKDVGTCNSQVGCIDAMGKCAGGACGTCSGDASFSCGCNLDCNGRCTTNGQCGVTSQGGSPTSVCLPDPTCYFGSPLPINNSGTSTCVLNTIADGVTGTADVAAGTANVTLNLKSWVYLTGADQDNFANGDACPICNAGVCNAGPRKGLSCVTNSTLKTTLDCPPPPYLFLAPLSVSLSPLTSTVVSTSSNSTGIFCPSQTAGGAFGVDSVRKIIQNGVAAAGGLDGTDKDATLASVFCIPITGNNLIDGAANLPGPGSTALAGTIGLR